MQKKSVAGSLLMALFLASIASAGAVNLMVKPIKRYHPVTLEELPFVVVIDTVIGYQPGLYQMEVSFTAQAAAGEKGWAGSTFDVSLTGSGLSKLLDSYEPNANTTDINGPTTIGGVLPIYQSNGDLGIPSNLNDIAASIASATISNANQFETRNYIGTPNGPPTAASPASIGTFYVQWNGFDVGAVNLTDHSFVFTSTNGTPTNYADDFFKPSVDGSGATFQFGRLHETPLQIVDEVDPIAILTGHPAVYANELDTVDSYGMFDTWSVIGLESYTPHFGPGLPPNELPGNPTVDNAGLFSWTTAGYDPGIYVWRLRATDTGGWSDDGFLTVTILTPEPASLALFGLGVISMGCLRGRLIYQKASV
jgi:hypothetical protein